MSQTFTDNLGLFLYVISTNIYIIYMCVYYTYTHMSQWGIDSAQFMLQGRPQDASNREVRISESVLKLGGGFRGSFLFFRKEVCHGLHVLRTSRDVLGKGPGTCCRYHQATGKEEGSCFCLPTLIAFCLGLRTDPGT